MTQIIQCETITITRTSMAFEKCYPELDQPHDFALIAVTTTSNLLTTLQLLCEENIKLQLLLLT